MNNTHTALGIIPFLKFLRYFGLCPFFYIESSTGIVRKVVIISYSFLLHGFLFYTILIISIKTLKNLITSEFNFDTFVYIAKDINLLAGYLIVPLLYWRWSSKLPKYFNKWFRFYEKLSNHDKACRINLGHTIIDTWIALSMSIFFGITLLLAAGHQFESIYSYGLIIMFGILSFLWNETCQAVVEALNQFELQLKNSRSRIKIFDFRTEEIISSWILLSKVIKSSCSLYSNLLFSSIQSMTLLVMFSVYLLFTQLVRREFDIHDCFHSILIMILAAGNIYTICNKSHYTERQVKSVIHKEVLWTGIFLSNTEKLIKVKQMLYIVRSTTPTICLFNFVSIDRRLMVNLLSVVVTYLVVLIQFQVTSSPSISNIADNTTTNGTDVTAANLTHV